jgi:hypothetical protein
MKKLYAHFQDLSSVYVGPFATREEITAHAQFCKSRGDGAELIEIVEVVPDSELLFSPEDDRESMDGMMPIDDPKDTSPIRYE